jgi:hypothetical protein
MNLGSSFPILLAPSFFLWTSPNYASRPLKIL